MKVRRQPHLPVRLVAALGAGLVNVVGPRQPRSWARRAEFTMRRAQGWPLGQLAVVLPSGRRHTVPLRLIEDTSSSWIVVARAGRPAWLRGLLADPESAMLRFAGERIRVVPEVIGGRLRDDAWTRVLLSAPDYARHAERSDAPLPLVRLRVAPPGDEM